MSFGGQSNAWQRNMMQGHPQSNSFHQGPPQMFMQTPQPNMTAFGAGGAAGGAIGGGMYANAGGGGGTGGAVSYPQGRGGLNPVAFQGGNGGGGGGGGGVGGNMGMTHYNAAGIVTKMNNDCGLINDEVFFYRNVCKGPEPKLGDRVIFESSFSSSGQFKWNATHVQLFNNTQQPMMNAGKSKYTAVAPPNEYQRSQKTTRHLTPQRMSPVWTGAGGGSGNARHDRERHDRDRDRDRERERERERNRHRSRDRDEEDRDRKRRHDDIDRSRDRTRNDRERDRDRDVRRDREVTNRDRTRDRERVVERERERTRERTRDRERDREHERERDRPAQEPEHHRNVVAKPRHIRPIKRYAVQIPKSLLSHKSADVQEIRNRFTTLYIPSDFFYANIKWTEVFTPDNPLSLRRPCKFHIMHKSVEPPIEITAEELDPPDADYLYSAKVMLLALPPIAHLYKKCFETNDEEPNNQLVHPSRLINFLVGIRGRNEPMAIGGPWSPSLDGENPDTDPAVLIRTAIRTCKALTGIDLSNCTQWYRFVELYYHRTEYKNMEKDGPPRVETVVIYLPDVHSCMPSRSEYAALTEMFKTKAENLIAQRKAEGEEANAKKEAAAAAAARDDAGKDEGNNGNDDSKDQGDDAAETEEGADAEAAGDAAYAMEGEADNSANEAEKGQTAAAEGDDENAAEAEQQQESHDNGSEQQLEEHGGDNGDGNDDVDMCDNEANVNAGAEAEDENDDPNPEPTHYTLLDLKSMKLQEIRDELLARDLPEKGPRNVVMARLAKALNTEKLEEIKAQQRSIKYQTYKKSSQRKSEDPDGDVDEDMDNDWADASEIELSDMVVLDEYDANSNSEESKMSKRKVAQILRHHTLQASPQIVVYPNKNARGGNFDCAVMSLSVLLDYHPEDTKERFFEVSLFAELFSEMLMRDFAFNIYKEVYYHKGKEASTQMEGTSEPASKAESDDKAEKTDANDAVNKESDNEEPPSKIRKRRQSTIDGQAPADNEKRTSSKSHRRADGSESVSSEDKKLNKPHRRMSHIDGRDDRAVSETGKKTVVVKPQLLLSFLYFDTTNCGYIFERDLEDLFSVMGLNLSRSQIKKVLSKLGTKNSVYYRNLTDKPETPDMTPVIEDIDDLPEGELKALAAGNNKYDFIFGADRTTDTSQPLVNVDEEGEGEDKLVHHNGAVVHVGKLIEQIKRSEKRYSDLEKLHHDVLKQHSDLRKDHNKTQTRMKELQTDVKSLSRKLIDTNQDMYNLNRKYRDQNATLSYIYTRVSPYFSRDKDKEKDKDSKAESVHDKEREDKEKTKEKSKPREKEPHDSHKDREKDKPSDRDKNAKDKESCDKDKSNLKLQENKELENDKTPNVEQAQEDEDMPKMTEDKAFNANDNEENANAKEDALENHSISTNEGKEKEKVEEVVANDEQSAVLKVGSEKPKPAVTKATLATVTSKLDSEKPKDTPAKTTTVTPAAATKPMAAKAPTTAKASPAKPLAAKAAAPATKTAGTTKPAAAAKGTPTKTAAAGAKKTGPVAAAKNIKK